MYTINEHNNPVKDYKCETHMEAMERLGADGIDFVPAFCASENCTIYASYTKEQFANVKSYPRSGYRFWKMIDGKKVYIDLQSGHLMTFEADNSVETTTETPPLAAVSTREQIAIDFIRLDADGIDFVSMNFNPMNASQRDIYESYNKREFSHITILPRSPYVFWKMIDGVKFYVIEATVKG